MHESLGLVSVSVALVGAWFGVRWFYLAPLVLAWAVIAALRVKMISDLRLTIRLKQKMIDGQQEQIETQQRQIDTQKLHIDLLRANPSMIIGPDLAHLVAVSWAAEFHDGELDGTTGTVPGDSNGLPPLAYAHQHRPMLVSDLFDETSLPLPRSYYRLVDIHRLTRLAVYEAQDAPVVVTPEDYQQWLNVLRMP